MLIQFNPKITGAFTELVLDSPQVSKVVDKLELTDDEAHELVKASIITAFRLYKININDLINHLRD
jgi:hypothetical protein